MQRQQRRSGTLTATTIAEAFAEVRRRIREDRRGVPEEIAGLLEEIAEALDDPEFDVRTVAGLTPQILGRFRLGIGLEANAYLDQRRLEIAYHLVCNTSLGVAEIAAGLGFRKPESFAKWFERRTGQTPEQLRHANGGARAVGEEPAQPRPVWQPSDGWPTEWDWERLILGATCPEEACACLRLLLAKYPELETELEI